MEEVIEPISTEDALALTTKKDSTDCTDYELELRIAIRSLVEQVEALEQSELYGKSLVNDWKQRATVGEKEADRLRKFLSEGSYQTIQSEQAWKQRAAEAEKKLDELRARISRFIAACDFEVPDHMCDFYTNPPKGSCEFHGAWADLFAVRADKEATDE